MRSKSILCAAFALATVAPSFAADGHAPHWEYKGKLGSQSWGDLAPEFAACKMGHVQSPIDIRGAAKGDLPALGFAYANSPAEVVNNGHTIQVNLASGGQVTVPSGAYKLVQFHFHTPSEEKVNGKSFPLVAHLVHKNEEGKLAVVGVLFKQGKANPALQQVFDVMPDKEGGKASLDKGFDASTLLPAKKTYYAYEGSLTTPPCSEGVKWQVLAQPVEMSAGQLAQFKKLYSMNARPVQPLNGRSVQISQ